MSNKEKGRQTLLRKQKMEEDKRLRLLLDQYWELGMKSAKSDLVAKAITSTGATGKQVKKYIDKKKRRAKYASLKATSQLPERKKKLRIKKTRGYDKFRSVRMQKPDLKNLPSDQQGTKMRIANAEWMAMAKGEKAMWTALAEEDNHNFQLYDQKVKRKLKKVKDMCEELWDLGVAATLLLPPEEGEKEALSVTHPPEMKPFWDKQLMDPVLRGFVEEMRQWELLYLMKAKAREDDRQDTAIDPEENQLESTEMPEVVHSQEINTETIEEAVVNNGDEIPLHEILEMTVVNGETVAPLAQTFEVTLVNAENEMPLHKTLKQTVVDVETVKALPLQVSNIRNEVIDLESKSPSEALKDAQAMAKKIEKKAAKIASEKENKKCKRKCKLIGRHISHLWAMTDKEKNWFDGEIVKREGDKYLIRYEDDEALVAVPVAEFQRFRRNKTLLFK